MMAAGRAITMVEQRYSGLLASQLRRGVWVAVGLRALTISAALASIGRSGAADVDMSASSLGRDLLSRILGAGRRRVFALICCISCICANGC